MNPELREGRLLLAPTGAYMILDPTDSFTSKSTEDLHNMMGGISIIVSGGVNPELKMKERIEAIYENRDSIPSEHQAINSPAEHWTRDFTLHEDGTFNYAHFTAVRRPLAQIDHNNVVKVAKVAIAVLCATKAYPRLC